MKRRRISFFTVLMLALAGAAAALAQPPKIAPDEYAEITLWRQGQPAQIEVELKEASLLSPYVLFAPDELGKISFTAKDSRGRAVDLYSPVPLKSGRYTVSIASEKPSPQPFNIMLRSLGEADDFSGAGAMTDPEEADLPFSKVLALRSYKDQAWYYFEAREPGVLLVRLASLGGGPGAEITVERDVKDVKNKDLAVGAMSITADSAGAATYYFDVKEKGLWRVGAARTGPPATGDESAFRFDIVFYPDKPDEDLPAFVALGVSKDDPNIQQLSLRMRAAGRRVIITNDPGEIEKALSTSATRTMKEAKRGGLVWLYWVLGVLVVAGIGGGYWFWWRRRTPKAVSGNN